MLRKISLLQPATFLTALTIGFAAASNTPPATQGTPSWDEVANALARNDFPIAPGPASQILPIVSIVIGGLMYALEDNPAKRVLPAIVFAVGLMIEAANYLLRLPK